MLEPKRIEVALDDRLSDLAGGIRVVSCSYLSGRRQSKVRAGVVARAMEAVAGFKMDRSAIQEAATAEKRQRERLEGMTRTPEEIALEANPADLVCLHTMREVDGEAVEKDAIEAWLDDVHPAVERAIATQVLRESGHVQETEAQAGEDSGGSPDS